MSSGGSSLGTLKDPFESGFFTRQSLFTNIDYLYWRVSPKMDDHQLAWILWYILKGMNNKVFCNIDVDPRDTLKFAET